MDRKLLSAIIVIIMITTATCAFIIYDQNREYLISYDLNGGLSDGSNPHTYSKNSNIVLNDAISEKYVFDGWYDGDGRKVTMIPNGSSGDISLRAEWISNVGKTIQYDVAGKQTVKQSQYLVDDTLSFTYIGDGPDGYLICVEGKHDLYYRANLLYSSKNVDQAFVLNISDWTADGNKYTNGESTVELNDQKVPISMHLISDTCDVTFAYVSESVVAVQPSYNVDISYDTGLVVTGSGEYVPGEKVTVTAIESDTVKFYGWYGGDGTRLSDSLDYTIEPIYKDIELVAESYRIADENVTAGTAVTIPCEYEMKECDWTIRDKYTWKIVATLSGGNASYTFEPGIYQITYVGIDADGAYRNGTYDILADGYVERSYHWVFDGTEYDCTLSIPYGEYVKYRESPINRGMDLTEPQNDARFVTYDNGIIGTLASVLLDLSENMTDNERAAFLLSFVQNIQYVYDIDGKGTEEYWKYPIETLFEEEGDCEDTSMLFAALGKRMGFDVSLFLLPGHMAGGIALNDFKGREYHCDGVTYYFAETTYPKYALGEVSSPMFTQNKCTVIRVN